MFVADATTEAMYLDGLNTTHAIFVNVTDPAEIESVFDAITYDKVSVLLIAQEATVEHCRSISMLCICSTIAQLHLQKVHCVTFAQLHLQKVHCISISVLCIYTIANSTQLHLQKVHCTSMLCIYTIAFTASTTSQFAF